MEVLLRLWKLEKPVCSFVSGTGTDVEGSEMWDGQSLFGQILTVDFFW